MTAVIEVNQAQINDVMAMLNGIEKDAVLALRRSINRTATGAKTLIAKELGKTMTLKSSRIKKNMVVNKAAGTKLSAVVTLKGTSIRAIDFTNRPLQSGVSIKKWKSKKPQKFKHAFYANIGNRYGIFTRAEVSPNMFAGRIPTVELLGPPITLAYEKTPGLSNQVETESADRLLREMDAQVNFILSKYD